MMESRPRVCGWDRQYPRPLRMGACQHQVPMLPCCRRLRTPAGLCYLRLRVPRYPLSPAVPCRPPGAVARRTRRLAHAHLQVAAGWLQQAGCRLQLGDLHRQPPRPGSWAVVDPLCGSPFQGSTRPRVSALRREDPENGEMEKWIFTSPTTSLAKKCPRLGTRAHRGSGRRFHVFGPWKDSKEHPQSPKSQNPITSGFPGGPTLNTKRRTRQPPTSFQKLHPPHLFCYLPPGHASHATPGRIVIGDPATWN